MPAAGYREGQPEHCSHRPTLNSLPACQAGNTGSLLRLFSRLQWRYVMCDYSLVAVASRPARVADRLITTGFRNTSTRGFAHSEDMTMAVCLRPGTEIAFDHPPNYH